MLIIIEVRLWLLQYRTESCQPVRRRSRCNSLFDQSLFYIAMFIAMPALRMPTISCNSTLTLLVTNVSNISLDELEYFKSYFTSLFYTQFPTAYLNAIFKLRDGTCSFIHWSLVWIISISIHEKRWHVFWNWFENRIYALDFSYLI